MYVFALVDRPSPPLRLSGRRIEFLRVGSVWAAVDRPAAKPPLSEETLRTQHDIVCRLGERFDAILPVRFGTFVEIPELRKVIARGDALGRAFDAVRGRAQMTVRVAGVPGEPLPVGAGLASRSGTDYLRTRRTAAAGRIPANVRERIEAAVTGLVAASRADQSPRLGVAIYHLVDREHVERYRSAIASLSDAAPDSSIRVSGPWPPFAFAPELWP